MAEVEKGESAGAGAEAVDVTAAAAPLLLASRAVGLLAGAVHRDARRRPQLRSSAAAVALSAAAAAVGALLNVGATVQHSLHLSVPVLSTFMFLIKVYFGSATVVLIGLYAWAVASRGRLGALLRECHVLCEDAPGGAAVCRTLRRCMRFACVTGALIICASNLAAMLFVGHVCPLCAFFGFTSSCLVMTLICFTSCQVNFFTFLLAHLFADVNLQLEKMADASCGMSGMSAESDSSGDDKFQKMEDTPSEKESGISSLLAEADNSGGDQGCARAVRAVRALARRHARLCGAARRLNAVYACALLLIAAHSYVQVVIGAYSVVSRLLCPDDAAAAAASLGPVDAMTAIAVCWVACFAANLVFIVDGCQAAARKANRTAAIVHHLLSQLTDAHARKELEIFSLQLLHRKVQFSAWGFFPLDFSLLYAIIGAVTTYLIILIQFQLSFGEEYFRHILNLTVSIENSTVATT